MARLMWLVVAVALALAAYKDFVLRSAIMMVAIAAMMTIVGLHLSRLRITPGRVIGIVVLVLAVPFMLATRANNEIWGYPFERPGLDRRIVDVRAIKTVTALEATMIPDGRREFSVAGPFAETYASMDLALADPYHDLDSRVIFALRARGLLSGTPASLAPADAARLYPLLESTGYLEAGDAGYDLAKQLRGVVVEATGDDGRPLLFFGVQGREFSNDHYPYYEFLLEGDAKTDKPKLLSHQRFYYDVAGVEGIEWPFVFPAFSVVALLIATPIGGLTILARRWKKRPAWPVSGKASEG